MWEIPCGVQAHHPTWPPEQCAQAMRPLWAVYVLLFWQGHSYGDSRPICRAGPAGCLWGLTTAAAECWWSALGLEMPWWLPVTSGWAGPKMAVRLIHGGFWGLVGRAAPLMAARSVFSGCQVLGDRAAPQNCRGPLPASAQQVISWLTVRHCWGTGVGRTLGHVHPQVRWRFPIWCHQSLY